MHWINYALDTNTMRLYISPKHLSHKQSNKFNWFHFKNILIFTTIYEVSMTFNRINFHYGVWSAFIRNREINKMELSKNIWRVVVVPVGVSCISYWANLTLNLRRVDVRKTGRKVKFLMPIMASSSADENVLKVNHAILL